MEFVISTYGDFYVPFLYVCVDSIKKNHKDASIVVVWDNISDKEMQLLQYAFSDVKFIKSDQNIFHKDIRKSIPLKLKSWVDYLNNSNKKTTCFLDSDIIVYKNISQFISDEYDLLFTWKPEFFLLNTGVIIVNNSERTRHFFELWLKKIEEIVADNVLLTNACNKNGAADQQALYELMGKAEYTLDFAVTYDFGAVKFRPVECNLLNQTNSVPMDYGSYIFHYKAGWHPILLKLQGYSEHRSMTMSYEMHRYWENSYNRINDDVLNRYVNDVAKKYVNAVDWLSLGHETRGILNSEMLAVITMIKEAKVDVVIESGRCRGQSTVVLAEALKNTDIKVISIELLRDENAVFSEKRLASYKHIDLLYGDAKKIIQRELAKYRDKNVAILFDGPKGKDAYEIFAKCIYKNKNIVVGFFHDCRKSCGRNTNISRDEIYNYFDRLFFTDHADYVEQFKEIDKFSIVEKVAITPDSWRPFYKGWDRIGSYGPTLAVVFPTERDRYRWLIQKKSYQIFMRIKKVLVKYLEKFRGRMINVA